MNSIYNKMMIALVVIFLLFSAYILFVFATDDSEDKFMEQLALHQRIEEENIENVTAEKTDLFDSTIGQIDIELTINEIKQIVTLFNAINRNEINAYDSADSGTVLGIMIGLKEGTAIRIDYNYNDIYVTRGEVKHIIESIELQQFLDDIVNKTTI